MKNVFVLLVDGLRADCLGSSPDRTFLERYRLAGGHSTPVLDAFLDRGVRFERAYASGTDAVPSTATILTGCHPPRHGVRCPYHAMSEAVPTLWEAFRDAGYRTLWANPPELAGLLGLDRGCETEFVGNDRELFAELERSPERPVLAVVSFDDVAPPYLHTSEPPVPGYHDEFLAELRALASRYAIEITVPEESRNDPDRMAEVWHLVHASLFARGLGHPVENLLPLYLKGLRRFDGGRFQAFRERLDASPSAADAIVVLTAPYAMAVHRPAGSPGDLFLHGGPPTEGAVRVPLSIAADGLPAGARRDGPVGHVDLAATLCELAGVAWPLERAHGRSLVPVAAGAAEAGRPCYSEHSQVELGGHSREFVRRAREARSVPEHRCLIDRRDLRSSPALHYFETGDQLRDADLALPDAEFVHALYFRLLGRWPRQDEHAAILAQLTSGSITRHGLVQYMLRQAKIENRYRLHDARVDPEERANLLALDEEGWKETAARLQTDLVRITLDA